MPMARHSTLNEGLPKPSPMLGHSDGPAGVYSPGRDLRPRIELNLRAYHEQTQRVQHRVDRSNTAWQALEDLAAQLGLRERQITALHDAVLTGRVRRLRYEHAENLTTQQSGRDLTDLTTRGLLTAHGQTKGRYYTVGRRLGVFESCMTSH